MRTVTLTINEGIGATANLQADGKEIYGVIRIEFDDLVPMHQWGGTLHFQERLGLEPEEVIFSTPELVR